MQSSAYNTVFNSIQLSLQHTTQSSIGCLQQYLGSASMHFTSSLEGEHHLDYNIQVDMSRSMLIARSNTSDRYQSSLQVAVGIQLYIPTIFNIHNDAAILTAVSIQLQNSRRKIYDQSSLTAACIHQYSPTQYIYCQTHQSPRYYSVQRRCLHSGSL